MADVRGNASRAGGAGRAESRATRGRATRRLPHGVPPRPTACPRCLTPRRLAWNGRGCLVCIAAEAARERDAVPTLPRFSFAPEDRARVLAVRIVRAEIAERRARAYVAALLAEAAA